MIYKPREDSELLAKYARKLAKGDVSDIGTGSGIQALAAASKRPVKKVLAVDIQQKVIDHCKTNIKDKKIQFKQSDLFENIKGKFDTIIFNPPYLPEDVKLKDLTLDGGKKGYEVLERFLNQVNDFLKPDGIILIVFSSLTKKDKIDEFIRNNLLESKTLDKQHIFFEDLFVYLIKKSSILKELEKKGIKEIKYFDRGKRGLIFTGNYKKKITIKIKNPSSEAIGRIQNEAKYLKLLNRYDIGPKFLFSNKNWLVYEFVEGKFILDYFKKSDKKSILKIIKDIYKQMYQLDKLEINKEEMHHPYKHIIIKNNKPILLDFERCHKTPKPHNITQFSMFLASNHLKDIFKKKQIRIQRKKMIELCKKYKKDTKKENYDLILKIL